MFLKKAVDPEEEQAKARKKAEKLAKREEEKEKRQRKVEYKFLLFSIFFYTNNSMSWLL